MPGRPALQRERAGREASRLDRTDGDDGVSDEPMLVVEVERQRDVLSAIAEKSVGELGRRRRIVHPSGESERCFRHAVRMVGTHRTGPV